MSEVEVKDELVIMSVEDVPKGYDDVESKLDTELGLYNVVSEIKSTSTLKSATSTMGKIKKWKGKVEAKRVEIKAPALALCEAIDTEAKRIQAKIVDAWTPWSDAIETYKAKLETEELERKASRLNAVDGLVSEEELQFIDIYNMDDETFNKFVEFRKSITIVPVEVIPDTIVSEQEEVIAEEPDLLDPPTIKPKKAKPKQPNEDKSKDENSIILDADLARDIVWGDAEGWETISEDIVDSSRWSIQHEGIFREISTNMLYRTHWSLGATEQQDEGPFEYSTPEFFKVKAVKVVVDNYVSIDKDVPTIDEPREVVEPKIYSEPTTPEPVDTNVGLLTDDDEFAMFNTFHVRFSKIKKPATFSSETATKLRNAIDDLDEMLNNALGGVEE